MHRKADILLLPEFSVIRLTTDRYLSESVGRGAIGVILEVEDHDYLTEFSRSDGTTTALIVLKPDDVEPAPELIPSPGHLEV